MAMPAAPKDLESCVECSSRWCSRLYRAGHRTQDTVGPQLTQLAPALCWQGLSLSYLNYILLYRVPECITVAYIYIYVKSYWSTMYIYCGSRRLVQVLHTFIYLLGTGRSLISWVPNGIRVCRVRHRMRTRHMYLPTYSALPRHQKPCTYIGTCIIVLCPVRFGPGVGDYWRRDPVQSQI